MFLKLAFLVVMMTLMLVTSPFQLVECVNDNGIQLFRFHWASWIRTVVMIAGFVCFAEYVRRKMVDWFGAIIFYCGVPLTVFISLGYAFERTEIDAISLRHYREPPFQEFNGNYKWSDIKSVEKNMHENQHLLTENYFRIGYQFTLNGGQQVDLPVSDTLTAAADEIDKILIMNKIPFTTVDHPLKN